MKFIIIPFQFYYKKNDYFLFTYLFHMYIDIVLKELDELEKRKDRISSNNYLNQCNKLKKKYDLYKTIDDNTTYLIDQINNNSMFINNKKDNYNYCDDYDLKK